MANPNFPGSSNCMKGVSSLAIQSQPDRVELESQSNQSIGTAALTTLTHSRRRVSPFELQAVQKRVGSTVRWIRGNWVEVVFPSLIFLLPLLVFDNLLRPGFESYWNTALPSGWMNVSTFSVTAYDHGYTNIDPLGNVGFSQVLTGLLVPVAGPYALHLVDALSNPVMGLGIYLFARRNSGNAGYAFAIALFGTFNPYTLAYNTVDVVSLYRTCFFAFFLLAYVELRVRDRITFLPVAMLTFALPSIHGASLFLELGAIPILEISYVFATRVAFRAYLLKVYVPLLLVGAFIAAHLHDLYLVQTQLAGLGTSSSQYWMMQRHSLVQVLTLSAMYPWENTLSILLPTELTRMVSVAFLLLIVLIIGGLLFTSYRLPSAFRADQLMRFLMSFSVIFGTYGVLFASRGSDFLGMNALLSSILPVNNVVDNGDDGIFMVLTLVASCTLLFRALTLAARAEVRPRVGGRAFSGVSQLLGLRPRHAWPVGKLIAIAAVFLLIIIAVPVIALSTQLNDAWAPAQIPRTSMVAYGNLSHLGSGYTLVLPDTTAMSFNYSQNELHSSSGVLNPTNPSFWNIFPDFRPYYYDQPYSSVLIADLSTNTIASRESFDVLSTELGIEYILSFPPSSVVSYWPSSSPAFDTAYLLNATDFSPISISSTDSLLLNPNYLGLGFASSWVTVSRNATSAIAKESAVGMMLPVMSPSVFDRYGRTLSAITFNRTIYAARAGSLAYVVPVEGHDILSLDSSPAPPFPMNPLSSMPVTSQCLATGNLPGTGSFVISPGRGGVYGLGQGNSGVNYSNSELHQFLSHSTPSSYLHLVVSSPAEIVMRVNASLQGRLTLTSGNLDSFIVPYWGGQVSLSNLTWQNQSRNFVGTLNSSQLLNGANLTMLIVGGVLTVILGADTLYSVKLPSNTNLTMNLTRNEFYVDNFNSRPLVRVSSDSLQTSSSGLQLVSLWNCTGVGEGYEPMILQSGNTGLLSLYPTAFSALLGLNATLSLSGEYSVRVPNGKFGYLLVTTQSNCTLQEGGEDVSPGFNANGFEQAYIVYGNSSFKLTLIVNAHSGAWAWSYLATLLLLGVASIFAFFWKSLCVTRRQRRPPHRSPSSRGKLDEQLGENQVESVRPRAASLDSKSSCEAVK